MTEDTEFSASASSLDNTGEEWEEPGLAAECSQAQGHCSLLSFLGNPCAGLRQKPLEAFLMGALAGMLLRLGTHRWRGMLGRVGTPAAG